MSNYYRQQRAFKSAQWAYDMMSPPEDDYEEEEDVEVVTSKVVTARKARYIGQAREIRPGDHVQVCSGFTYIPGGPRTGYLPKRYYRLEKGPAWGNECQIPGHQLSLV